MKIPLFLVSLLAILAVLTPEGTGAVEQTPSFEARLVPAGWKVFPDSPLPCTGPSGFRLIAVRNEYVPFQVVIRARKGTSDLSVAITDPSGPKGRIPVRPGALLLVENVVVKKPSLPVGARERGAGPWPDPLPPLKPFRVGEGETRAVWIDFFIPPGTQPGMYRGIVIVTSRKGCRLELPFDIDVRPITLPDRPSLRTAFGNGVLGKCAEKVHAIPTGTARYRELLEEYYWFLVAHRLSPYYIPVSLYSEEAHRFLDDPRVTFFVIPGNSLSSSAEMKRLSARLEQTGWIDKGAFYVIDEPEEEDFSTITATGRKIHAINPRFRHLVTFQSGRIIRDSEALEEVDILVPLLSVMTGEKERMVLMEEREKGKELWWYTCVVPKWKGMNYFIDEEGSGPRLHPWMNHLFGNTGILYWATDNWTGTDCDPWSETETFPGGNGDGSLLYPGKDFAGPVASIRLKLLREGLEEYELLTLLQRRLEAAAAAIGGRAAAYRPEERLFEYALALFTEEGRIQGPSDGSAYLRHLTRDAFAIERERERVIDELETVPEAPLFLVSSSPVDGSVTTLGLSVVRGYTKTGTLVTVNGVPVPIRENGFETRIPLRQGRNKIIVKATDTNGRSKTAEIVLIKR